MVPGARRRQDPGLVDQLGKIDVATACPSRIGARHDDQFVVEEHFCIQVIRRVLVGKRRYNPLQDAIIFSIAQPRSQRFRCAGADVVEMYRHAADIAAKNVK